MRTYKVYLSETKHKDLIDFLELVPDSTSNTIRLALFFYQKAMSEQSKTTPSIPEAQQPKQKFRSFRINH